MVQLFFFIINYVYCLFRSSGPLSFGFQSLENQVNAQGSNSKCFSNPVADLGIMTTPSLTHRQAISTEIMVPFCNETQSYILTTLCKCVMKKKRFLLFKGIPTDRESTSECDQLVDNNKPNSRESN